MKSGWLVVIVCATGCWPSETLLDGAFTPAQWAHLQAEFQLPPVTLCAGLEGNACAQATALGGALFADSALSCGASMGPVPCTPVSCQTCHDPSHAWIDSRAPNNVSLGATGWTKHNAMTTLDLGYKQYFAGSLPPPANQVFSYTGGWKKPDGTIEVFTRPSDVVDLALTKAMASDPSQVASVIRTAYAMPFYLAFGAPPSGLTDEQVYGEAKVALEAFLVQPMFQTGPTPFDLWLHGTDTPLMTDAAKRGFAVFVGRGTCIECHKGPLLTDLEFHDTGVPQSGANVPLVDNGRADITEDPADAGAFLTGSLREIARTGPYMHDGAFATLGDVIAFYRGGGVPTGYAGTRDPRIVALDIDDGDARDLEAFLDALVPCGTDNPCSTNNASGHGSGACTAPDGRSGVTCSNECVDLASDPLHCGSCTRTCSPAGACMAGTCLAPPPPDAGRPPGTAPCSMGACVP